VSSLLRELHALASGHAADRVPSRRILAYRCLNGTAPQYLADGLQRVADISSHSRLRSVSTALLHVPRSNHKTISDRERLEQSAAVDDVIAVVVAPV